MCGALCADEEEVATVYKDRASAPPMYTMLMLHEETDREVWQSVTKRWGVARQDRPGVMRSQEKVWCQLEKVLNRPRRWHRSGH